MQQNAQCETTYVNISYLTYVYIYVYLHRYLGKCSPKYHNGYL